MRKRRRLANKMTIMVCAVLIAVSTFFYAPMEVKAEESIVINPVELTEGQLYSDIMTYATNKNIEAYHVYAYALTGLADNTRFDFSPYLNDGSGLYKVQFTFSGTVSLDYACNFYNHFTCLNVSGGQYQMSANADNTLSHTNYQTDFVVYVDSNDPIGVVVHMFTAFWGAQVPSQIVNLSYSITDVVATKVTSEDSSAYQNGYNAGYSAGETAGYGNGYSQGFTDGEASVDTDAIYDEAFQAGVDSVDTDSYYDAGYQAGYQVAYSEGYESGYDVGYQNAMDRIESWGADTSDYPLEISSGNTNAYFSVHVGSDIPFNYRDSDHWFSSSEYNPNHTYKYVINFSNVDEGLDSDILYDYWDIYLNIGGIEYNITPFQDMSVSVFIPGDRISTSYSFDWVLYNCANYVADDSNLAYLYVDYDFVIYDMGPSGDTQNHIANQTDQLTNGYDDSKGNQVNSDLSTGLNDYETAENSLFATATTGMRDFTFFDFESVPAMITGMSFIGSIMGSWFNQAGGASGVGIVLSILFSVILVAMVLGLYRWYQSRGGKN